MSSYQLSNQAKKDLSNIWLFTYEKWSLQQADQYLKIVESTFQFIAANKQAGKSIKINRGTYHYFPVKSHLVFYRITNSNSIKVVRILHKNMDYLSHL